MGKYKKILLVVLTVSLLLVTVCLIPAAAATATVHKASFSQPLVTSNSGYIELEINHSWILMIYYYFALPQDYTDVQPYFTLGSDNVLIGSFDLGTTSSGSDSGCLWAYYGFLDSTASLTPFYSSGFPNVQQGFNQSWVVTGAHSYGPAKLEGVPIGNFTVVYGEDNILNEKLDLIYSAILSTTNNSQSIIQNQNENTDKIIEQQQENTDKILNGGSDEPPYSAPDTSGTDEVHEKEAYIFENTTEGRDTAVSVFNNVGAVFNDSSFANGMLFVSSFFNEFFGISWLNSIGSVSLALGAFAFVIGSVVVIGRNVVSRRKGGD